MANVYPMETCQFAQTPIYKKKDLRWGGFSGNSKQGIFHKTAVKQVFRIYRSPGVGESHKIIL